MKDILEKLLISRLNLIRQTQEFMPDQLSQEAKEITDLIKQYAGYDFCAQNLRKIQ